MANNSSTIPFKDSGSISDTIELLLINGQKIMQLKDIIMENIKIDTQNPINNEETRNN